ncbi:uncharacterized protein CLUP02_14191 [Colletotrichum lupini]|uniref:Uncharacterized protein n=1 Tax=Colletotrichum lupini TaxID=145971 RepID=A0A9Q8T3S2_9PEZI|nr:uncharacterized protein CLUP02_14191 [Colletotrichum lupini]UQC88666.1 hypothetical protein CLUP02_14191 [Colletotrichum lupini]
MDQSRSTTSSSTVKSAGDTSPMLQDYLGNSRTITEKLYSSSKRGGKTTKNVQVKKIKTYLGDWQDSWDKMATSKK